MRVISQDGTIDVPYKLTSIQLVSKTTIIAQGSYFGSSSDDNFVTVAEYSTEAKAIKAMEMLRDQYKRLEVFKVLASGAVEHIGKTLKNDELVEYNQAYRDMNVFQFPQDDEIEV